MSKLVWVEGEAGLRQRWAVLEDVLFWRECGVRRVLVVLPSGDARVQLGADLLCGLGQPAVYLAGRRESLVLCRRELASDSEAAILIASWNDSLATNHAVQAVVLEGCHRLEAATYRLLGTLYPRAIFVGLSSYAERDGRPLPGNYEEKVVCGTSRAMGPRPTRHIVEALPPAAPRLDPVGDAVLAWLDSLPRTEHGRLIADQAREPRGDLCAS